MTLGIIDPRLFSTIEPYYPLLCTIMVNVETQLPTGEIVKTFVPFAGHEAIPAYLNKDQMRKSKEERQGHSTFIMDRRAISLTGYFPAIREKMQAFCDGINYDIQVITHDSQHYHTFLEVELIR